MGKSLNDFLRETFYVTRLTAEIEISAVNNQVSGTQRSDESGYRPRWVCDSRFLNTRHARI